MDSLIGNIAVLVPLFTIAGSAFAFVFKEFRDAKENRRRELLELMALLDQPGTLATKLASIYRLRDFTDHEEFVVRFCEAASRNVTGPASEDIKSELRETALALKSMK